MPYTDVTVNDLIVNVLTQDEYDSIQDPSNSELYLITDDAITPAQAVEDVSTVSAVGTSTQYARADHVHAITGTAITSALGYTPGQGTLTDSQVNGTSIVSNGVANFVTNTAYNASTNKLATMSDVDDAVSGVTAPVTSVNTKTGAVVLTASDVGALPDTTAIPTKVSDLQNDAGYMTSYTETDPTVPAWAKASTKPAYTAAEVGALPDTYVPPEEVIVVTFTKVDETSYTANKTFDEVLAAKYAVACALTDSGALWRWYARTLTTSSSMGFSRQQNGKCSYFTWIKSSGNIIYSSQELELQSLKVTEITSSSTNNQYPSAKATYDFVTAALSDITSFSIEVVQSLPATGEQGVFYFVPNSGSGNNVYDEYIYVNNAFEKIGSTEIDLSEYAKTFIVTLTYDSQTETYSADKTYDQISTALSDGYYVMVYDGSHYIPYTFTGCFVDDRHLSHNFISIHDTLETMLTSDIDEYGWAILGSDDVSQISRTITIPENTSDLTNDSGFIMSSDIPITDVKINNTSILSSGTANIVTNTAYNASSNKIATMSDIPEDKLFLVTATMSGLTTGTSDKSVTEIAAAVAAGKFVYIKTTVGTTTIVAPLMHVVDTVDVSKAVFNYDDQQNSSQLYHAVLEITGTTVTVTWTNEKYARESQIPDSTSDLTNDSGFITAATAPVTSVNSQTGNVVLTIPTATSDLTNDSGFITTIPAVTATGVLSFTNLNDVIEITHDTPAGSDPEKLVSAVYPITIDSYGHITTAGSAVTIPSEITESTVSGWGFTKNAGTVTSVTASGALTSSGGATPTITHNAPATSPAKGTQAVYPITIDSYGHILSAGSAVTIPSNVSSFTNDAGYLTLATLPIYNGEVS